MARSASIEPVVLAIMDGWGNRADADANAIAEAKTPIFDRLAARGVRTMLATSGEAVGLAPNQPGNAEAGHRAIGTGRIELQANLRIAKAIAGENGESLSDNPQLRALVQKAKSVGGAVHLIGLISPAAVQGHQYHTAVLAALLSHEGVQVWVHAILDGEDSKPMSGADHLSEFLDDIEGAENADLASVMGRRFALDRLRRPTQLSRALSAMGDADVPVTEYAVPYVAECYDKGIADADVPPAVMPAYRGIRQDDLILVSLLRPNAATPLLLGLLGGDDAPVKHTRHLDISAVYSLGPLAPPLAERTTPFFDLPRLNGTLSEALAASGKRQSHISDATFPEALGMFQTGGRTALFEGETRLVVPGPKKQQFEKKPELSALDMADELVSQVKANKADVYLIHFPNVAYAAHMGDQGLARKAAETIDKALGKITAILEKRGGTLVITGSHGNAEDMRRDDEGRINASNTRTAVPFIIDGPKGFANTLGLKPGRLSDVAPTLLTLLNLSIPQEMTGQALLVSAEAELHETA
ncbi:MAG: hypothetical protein RLN89_09055 [Parvibaculum sp.]